MRVFSNIMFCLCFFFYSIIPPKGSTGLNTNSHATLTPLNVGKKTLASYKNFVNVYANEDMWSLSSYVIGSLAFKYII